MLSAFFSVSLKMAEIFQLQLILFLVYIHYYANRFK